MSQESNRFKKTVKTVTGPISANELGFCQCHEHLFIRKGIPWNINPALWMDDLNASQSELSLYRQTGGQAIVDAQPVGCGRMAIHLKAASEQSGIRIIASTGFHKLQYYSSNHWIHKMDETALKELFIHEITVGMYSDGDDNIPSNFTESRAGIVKTALNENGLSDIYKKLFSAAAAASLATGAPIMVHTEKDSDVLALVEYISNLGVLPKKLIFCHMDRTHLDFKYHDQVARTGVYLEYDTIGRFKYHSDEEEISLIRYMIEAGWAGRILFGLDTTRNRLRNYGGSIGLDYILSKFIPALISSGITEEIIKKITIENPMDALSIE